MSAHWASVSGRRLAMNLGSSWRDEAVSAAHRSFSAAPVGMAAESTIAACERDSSSAQCRGVRPALSVASASAPAASSACTAAASAWPHLLLPDICSGSAPHAALARTSAPAVTSASTAAVTAAASWLKPIAARSGVNPQWSLALTSAPASKAARMAAKHSARLGTCTAASRAACSSGVSRGCPSVDLPRAGLLHSTGLGAGAAERGTCLRVGVSHLCSTRFCIHDAAASARGSSSSRQGLARRRNLKRRRRCRTYLVPPPPPPTSSTEGVVTAPSSRRRPTANADALPQPSF